MFKSYFLVTIMFDTTFVLMIHVNDLQPKTTRSITMVEQIVSSLFTAVRESTHHGVLRRDI